MRLDATWREMSAPRALWLSVWLSPKIPAGSGASRIGAYGSLGAR
jgi:hypothetical protein